MSTNNTQPDPGPAREQSGSRVRGWISAIFRFLLTIAIMLGGGAISAHWLSNRPKASRQKPETIATLVDIEQLAPSDEQTIIHAKGRVVPARNIQLSSRVSGEIDWVNQKFVPGGYFKKSEKVLRIDAIDYRLAVEKCVAELTKAESNLQLEMGQQSVAKKEYQLLRRKVEDGDMELLLRRPQLAIAKATVTSAKATLKQAECDLERTDIAAPWNAMIQSRSVDTGSQVNAGASLAALVGTDEYWVQVSIPMDQLKWIDIPGGGATGSPVRIYHESAWGSGVFRMGSVERLMTSLEPQGRMARLLVLVKDPMDLLKAPPERNPLILDSFVRVEIDGRLMPKVFRVPRFALHDGGRVWVMSPEKKLEIREVRIVWSGSEHVYVSDGLRQNDRLIVSDLNAPVSGMLLRTHAEGMKGSAEKIATGKQAGERSVGQVVEQAGDHAGGRL